MINALVTGSQKYGEPTPDSDIDIVLMVDTPTRAMLWKHSHDEDRVYYPRTQFIVTDIQAVRFMFVDDQKVIITCGMSEEDERLIGGLHEWVRTADSEKAFTSTYTNTHVNLIPVNEVRIWNIWVNGTQQLVEMSKQHGPVKRQNAIDFFTFLGMPRFNS